MLFGVEGWKMIPDGGKAGALETWRFRVGLWVLRSPWFAGSQRVDSRERLDVEFTAL